jgi:signal transduction histidine kinase
MFVWIIILAISRYRKAENNFKKQIILLVIGIEAFILAFSAIGFVISYLVSSGAIVDFNLELYALFGMPVFMAFLAYLIVKYKAFNIKLIGAQALVVALLVLIGSQFFFIQNNTNRILTGITLALALGFGYLLIQSVKNEVKRKEELQYMSDQLAKANDQLRKLDNAKSDFISIASHQLRTPLTSIKGFISLILEGSYGKITAIQQETLNKVYQSNERLIHLVEDLLNISRIESGRMEFQFAPCQLADLCQEVVDGLSIRAKDNKLYLDYKKPEAPLPEIMIDAGKVREVISNMVDNALKYTPKGGVKVNLEQKEANLRVTVSDTGIGIPATELPYLFSKFSRGKDTSRLNTGGTGLGLYVGRAMIEQNGGKIWAESEGEGKGSRFIIELPVKQSQEILAQWEK